MNPVRIGFIIFLKSYNSVTKRIIRADVYIQFDVHIFDGILIGGFKLYSPEACLILGKRLRKFRKVQNLYYCIPFLSYYGYLPIS